MDGKDSNRKQDRKLKTTGRMKRLGHRSCFFCFQSQREPNHSSQVQPKTYVPCKFIYACFSFFEEYLPKSFMTYHCRRYTIQTFAQVRRKLTIPLKSLKYLLSGKPKRNLTNQINLSQQFKSWLITLKDARIKYKTRNKNWIPPV